jgi:hypothetical protein
MAKKKRKKRPVQRPSQGTGTATAARPEAPDRSPSARAERKEQARRERERRIKLARRRQRIRRATRWGAAAGVVALIAGGVYLFTGESREARAEAQAAARALNCTPVDLDQAEQPDPYEGMSPEEIAAVNHSPPFASGQNGVPATAGPHSQQLPSDPAVYEQPVPEANIVHNLEHGYALIYYAAAGENALSDDIRSELEEVARSQSEVIMAPYPDLASPMALVAWRELQQCDPGEDADPEDALVVAEEFIDRFKNGSLAPEPAAG